MEDITPYNIFSYCTGSDIAHYAIFLSVQRYACHVDLIFLLGSYREGKNNKEIRSKNMAPTQGTIWDSIIGIQPPLK